MSKRLLYELVDRSGRSFSPFVWSARALLRYKGLPYETVPLTLTQIHKTIPIVTPTNKLVPVLVDGENTVFDSFQIALYLEKYDKSIFPDKNIEAVQSWCTVVRGIMLQFLRAVNQIHMYEKVADEDKEYFLNEKVNKQVGGLEQGRRNYEDAKRKLHANFALLEKALKENRKEGSNEFETYFFGKLSFADIAVGGLLHWCVSAVGEQEAFGDNEFLRRWFANLKSTVNLNE